MTDTVLVYGAGISGCGAAEVLIKNGKKVILYNDVECNINSRLRKLLLDYDGCFICGNGESLLEKVNEIVVSPGIDLENPLVKKAQELHIPIVGEVEIAYRYFAGHILAVTGTNGKTTTTALIGEMLKTLSIPSAVGGNIGVSLAEEANSLPENAWLAAELSSFQLETIKDFRAEIAIVLNLTEDHLTRHHTMEKYGAAKKRIFVNQKFEDILILNYDDPQVRSWGMQAKGKVCYFSRKQVLKEGVYIENDSFIINWASKKTSVCNIKELKIFGGHNEENILAAIAGSYFAGVDIDQIHRVLQTFTGVEHRLEYVTTVAGVPYYNDSKATNPDSTIKALEAFAGKMIVIAGGRDKLTDLTSMMQLMQLKADVLILLGEAQERFYKAAVKAGVKQIEKVNTMDEAVMLAYKLAKQPQVVVLSPACSSFDMFKDFPARGRYFKKLVTALTK